MNAQEEGTYCERGE